MPADVTRPGPRPACPGPPAPPPRPAMGRRACRRAKRCLRRRRAGSGPDPRRVLAAPVSHLLEQLLVGARVRLQQVGAAHDPDHPPPPIDHGEAPHRAPAHESQRLVRGSPRADGDRRLRHQGSGRVRRGSRRVPGRRRSPIGEQLPHRFPDQPAQKVALRHHAHQAIIVIHDRQPADAVAAQEVCDLAEGRLGADDDDRASHEPVHRHRPAVPFGAVEGVPGGGDQPRGSLHCSFSVRFRGGCRNGRTAPRARVPAGYSAVAAGCASSLPPDGTRVATSTERSVRAMTPWATLPRIRRHARLPRRVPRDAGA